MKLGRRERQDALAMLASRPDDCTDSMLEEKRLRHGERASIALFS